MIQAFSAKAIIRKSFENFIITKNNKENWWRGFMMRIIKSSLEKSLCSSKLSPVDCHLPRLKLQTLGMNSSYKKFLGKRGKEDLSKSINKYSKLQSLARYPIKNVPELFRDKSKPPIKILIAPVAIGAIAIFYHLKYILGYNIDLDLSFEHGAQLSDQVRKFYNNQKSFIREMPDFLIIPDATSTNIWGLKDFEFICLMPENEQRFIESLNSQKNGEKVFHFVSRDGLISTPELAFDKLRNIPKNKLITSLKKGKYRIEYSDPSQWNSVAKKSNHYSIMFTPHWQIYHELGLGKLHLEFESNIASDLRFDLFMFMNNRFKEDKRSEWFHSVVVESWKALSANDQKVRDEVMLRMIYYGDFMAALRHHCNIDEIYRNLFLEVKSSYNIPSNPFHPCSK